MAKKEDKDEQAKPDESTATDTGSEGTEAKPKAKGKAQRSEGTEEAAFQKTANDMKDVLEAQKKVTIMVPYEPGEPKGTQLPVNINGYRVNVPKGVYVEVPQTVAEIVMASQNVYQEASSAVMSQNDPAKPLRLDLQGESDKQALDS
jgi:hypothetical protein